jgi:hypothetical protein
MFGQLCVAPDPEPEPDPGDVAGGAVVCGEALPDGPTSGDTLGVGEVAACAATSVPNPIAIPSPPAATNFATWPFNQAALSIVITSLARCMVNRHRSQHFRPDLSKPLQIDERILI